MTELPRTASTVIVGGGIVGTATAFFLANNHGMRNIALIDSSLLIRRTASATTGAISS